MNESFSFKKFIKALYNLGKLGFCECYDNGTHRVMKENCSKCHGTGVS